jgi:CRP/FNR family cyclic AMP-dependent transcriptional regulator
MSLKLSSRPPIESKRRSKALGETLLEPPPVILSPAAAARRAKSRLRKATRGDPRRICRNAEHPQEVFDRRLFDVSTLGVQNRVDAELLRLAKEFGVVANGARIDPAP